LAGKVKSIFTDRAGKPGKFSKMTKGLKKKKKY
jgi:hypothetical protein